MRSYREKKNIVTLVACLIFSIFVFSYEVNVRNRALDNIHQHARIISSALWNVNETGAAEYLNIVALASNYTSLTVYESDGRVFVSAPPQRLSPAIKVIHKLGLAPEITLTSDILHFDEPIGAFVATWIPDTIFTHLYAWFLLAMFTAILHFYLKANRDKEILEDRVEARTAELEQSNRALLLEIHRRKKRTVTLRKNEAEYRRLYRDSKVAEEVYRSLIDSSADAIVICDLEHKIDYTSTAFTTVFGWTSEEVYEKSIECITPSGEDSIRTIFEDIKQNGTSYQAVEAKGVNKSGQPLNISISASRFNDHQSQASGILFVIRDISEKKTMEKQLQRAERMEAIGTLAGGIAHDFNNLLMGIQGNTSLALMETFEKNSLSERLEAIEIYVKNGQELTSQLLGFARGGKYEVKVTNLNQLIQAETAMFARTRKDIVFHTKYQEEIWPVEVDRGQLRQVLLNLFVNAGQAMHQGGSIQVTTSNSNLERLSRNAYEIPPGKYVQIFVTDTGHGMDRQTQMRIFDPFFTTKEIGRGTGLGLASAYGIVKNHNGFIDVYSEVGVGTTFTIYLPASTKTVDEDNIFRESDLIQGGGHILLVDDESMILEVGKEMLTTIGYEVTTASSGSEACKIFTTDSNSFHAVILDMIMPDMDGGMVYDVLTEINPQVKVLLSSGYSLNDRAMGILNRGCAGFLQKPFDIKQLSTKVHEVMQL